MESACNKRVLAALVACVALLPAASSPAADAAMQPVRVCEVLETPDAYDGKALALLGRFSFREDGRFIGEESCGKELKTGSAILRLSEDSKPAPRPDGALQIDAAALDRKLAAVRERTALRNTRSAPRSTTAGRWCMAASKRASRTKVLRAPRRIPCCIAVTA